MRKPKFWSIVATVAIVLMVSAMIPITTAQGPLTNTMGKSAQPVNDEFGLLTNGAANTSFKQLDLEKLVAGLQNPLLGVWNVTGNDVSGQFVSFMVDNSTGAIMDYALNTSTGQKVVLLNNFSGLPFKLSDWSAKGPLLVASNGKVGAVVHNNPEGTMHLASTTNASVNVTLASGVTVATMQSSWAGLKAWRLTANGVNCVLMVYNGTVTPGTSNQTGNQTTPVTPVTPTNQTQNQTSPGNVTTQPVCSIKLVNGNATNTTNLTSTPGTQLTINLEKDSFVVLRAIPSEPGFSAADEEAIANAIVNGQVNTEMSIQSAMVRAANNATNVTATNQTGGNVTAGNETANRTTVGPFQTMWYSVEYFSFSLTQVTKAAEGNLTIEIAPFKPSSNVSASNVTSGNQTAGNVTANQTATQNATSNVSMPKIWVISVNDVALGEMNKSAVLWLDGKAMTKVSSIAALSATSNDAYFMVNGLNATKFVVSIADPSVTHNITVLGSMEAGNTSGGNSTSSSPSTAGTSGSEVVLGIGLLGIAAIAAAVIVVRRKK